MKEYTILGIISVGFAFVLDKILGQGIFKKRIFWLFLLIIFFFKLLVNGFLTAGGVVLYNPRFFMGVRIGSIPLEDFLFGFSMVSTAIISWEYFKKRT